MWQVPEQMNALVRNSLESVNRLAAVSLDSAERMAELQMKLARKALADVAERAKTMGEAKDLAALAQLNPGSMQAGLDQANAYAREVYALASAAQTDLRKLFEEQVTALNKQAIAALDAAAKNAPAGSDYAISAFKSAIATATSTYDNVAKAAKQFTEATQANVSQAAQGGRRKAA